MGHAFAALLTGGSVSHITVSADASGLTYTLGGMDLIVSSAGYVGASIVGVLIILFSRSPQGARVSLYALGTALAASMLLWVRADRPSDWAGIVSGLVWILLLFGMAARLPDRYVLFAAAFVGVQQCLHSIMSLLTVLGMSMFREGTMSDASNLELATHIPAVVWAIGWSAFSLLLMGITLKGVLRRNASAEATATPDLY
jgi:hypothetical protein